jgi:hypothetical protein
VIQKRDRPVRSGGACLSTALLLTTRKKNKSKSLEKSELMVFLRNEERKRMRRWFTCITINRLYLSMLKQIKHSSKHMIDKNQLKDQIETSQIKRKK